MRKVVKVEVTIIDQNEHKVLEHWNIFFFAKSHTWFQVWENFRSLKRHINFLIKEKC